MPILKGDEALGVIALYGDEENAYSDSDVRLLQTLANAMSVALQNARLFDETQRLLKETEQRAAELAIINSVQQALAAELNMQGIYDAVGDKIREIFKQPDMGIRIYDPHDGSHPLPVLRTKTGSGSPSIRDRCRSADSAPTSCAPAKRSSSTRTWTQEMEKYGSFTIPGTRSEKSLAMVPLVVGDQARGLICLYRFRTRTRLSRLRTYGCCRRSPTA